MKKLFDLALGMILSCLLVLPVMTFTGCSDDDDDDNSALILAALQGGGGGDDTGNKESGTGGTDGKTDTSTGGKTDTGVAVTATWDFSSAAPEGITTTETSVDISSIAATSGSGATLSCAGLVKWANGSGLVGKANTATLDNIKDKSGAKFVLTLNGETTVTIIGDGAGSSDAKRIIATQGADGTNITELSKGSLASGAAQTLTKKLSKGAYTIYFNGARVKAITCASGTKDTTTESGGSSGTQGDTSQGSDGGTKALYAWTFQDLDLSKFTTTDSNAAKTTATKISKPTCAAFTLSSKPQGLTLSAKGVADAAGVTTGYNCVSNADGTEGMTAGKSTDGTFKEGGQKGTGLASNGFIETVGTSNLTVEVTGPFKAYMAYSANSSSAKTDRKAQIAVGTEVKAESASGFGGSDAKDYAWLSYDGTSNPKGTKVTVGFGGSGITRIYDIQIEQ